MPVKSLFPTKSARWVADNCREGRIPGAVKFGRTWMIKASTLEKAPKTEAPSVFTVEDALADLRRRGIIV